MLKYICSIFIAINIVGCSSGPIKAIPSPSEYSFDVKGRPSVKVITIGGENRSGYTTSMISAGGLFLALPTGNKVKPMDAKTRVAIAKNMIEILAYHNVFTSIEYVGDGAPIPDDDYILLNFIDTFVGEDGWPLTIKIQYIYKSGGNIVLDKTYEGSATLADLGCGNCLPDYIAVSELHSQFFSELNTKLK
jgi:hypothetical protein